MIEPPYGVIWNRLKAGKVVPFLGAGASLVGRPQGAAWDEERSAFLPSGRELSRLLAGETSFPDEDSGDSGNLAKVASYYVDINGRPVLRERLREVLNREFPVGELHHFLASVPAPQVIVVTNYDTLVEQAFRAAGKFYDLVVHPADRKDFANAVLWWPHDAREPIPKAPNELDIDLDRTTVIYKMHGTIDRDSRWDNFVITEEDYVEFLSRMTANTAVPALLYQHFRERSFLFLGYGLSDWNLRVILKNLSRLLLPKRGNQPDDDVLPSWAIQHRPSELERTLWKNRNVSIFDLTVEEFVAKLQARQKS
jgi:PAS domain-containing protein